MHVLPRTVGYLALWLTPAALIVRALGALEAVPLGVFGFGAGLFLVGAVAVGAEYERAFGSAAAVAFERADAVDAAAVVTGAVVTYALHVRAAPGPVLASALVGLGVGVVGSRRAVPAYCGSFAGMASPTLFPSVAYVAAAGTLAGLGYVAAKRVFAGFGGKLGTLAFFGCVATASLTGVDYAAAGSPDWGRLPLVVPVAVGGAVATVVLSRRLNFGVVVGSGLVGVAAALAFPVVAPGVGATLAAVAFCASFVGMSASERLDGEVEFALAGALCGVVFVAAAGAFPGAGGKLGTVAFVSCICYSGAARLLGARLPFP